MYVILLVLVLYCRFVHAVLPYPGRYLCSAVVTLF